MSTMFTIQPARFGGAGAPVTQSAKYKTSEAIIKGSILTLDANGELNLNTSDGTHPADASIIGVAAEAADSKPGFNVGQTDANSQYTGRVQEISYFKANRSTLYWGTFSADGAVVTTPSQTLIGEKYKLTKATDGSWYVDSSDQSPANVQIIDIDIDTKRVIFKFTEAALLEP